MSGRLQDQVAVVTGASRGIGEAIAAAFAAEGARVALCSRKLRSVEEAAARIHAAHPHATLLPLACHTGDPEAVAGFFEAVSAQLGTPSILVNNAATNPYFGPLLQTEAAAWDKTFDVNVKGYFYCSREAAQRAIAQHQPLSIINVASILGLRAAPLQGAYGMTKAAILSMTQTLAVELGEQNVRVNAIAPGLVDTRFAAVLIQTPEVSRVYTDRTALKRYAQPEEITGAAVFLASRESSYMTGQTLTLDGGYTAA